MKRLEIGCGVKLHKGYEGLDIRDIPGIKYPGVDARHLPIKDNTYDEVFAYWLLEHFGWNELVAVLQEWRRVLKPGGVLKIITNNQAAHNRCLAGEAITWKEWVRLTYGLRYKVEGGIVDCHKIGFTESILREFLNQAGFENATIEVYWQCRELDGSIKCPALVAVAAK